VMGGHVSWQLSSIGPLWRRERRGKRHNALVKIPHKLLDHEFNTMN
jgi:hypothetical protein